jgi:hypothetical protein
MVWRHRCILNTSKTTWASYAGYKMWHLRLFILKIKKLTDFPINPTYNGVFKMQLTSYILFLMLLLTIEIFK